MVVSQRSVVRVQSSAILFNASRTLPGIARDDLNEDPVL